jgi:hypothetical protein
MTSNCFTSDDDHLGLIIDTNIAFTIKNTWNDCIFFDVLDVFYTLLQNVFSESKFFCKRYLASYIWLGANGICIVTESVWLLTDDNQNQNVSETIQ